MCEGRFGAHPGWGVACRSGGNLANKSNYQELPAWELEAIPLSFSIVNTKEESEGFAYLFMSDDKPRDAQWGILEITIRNAGETPIELTAKSRLEVEIPTDLMTSAEVAGIRLSAASMQCWELSGEAKQKLELKLIAGQSLSITKDQPLKIMLERVLADTGNPTDRAFTFIWSEFGGIKNNSRAFRISRDFIPGPKDTEADIGCTWLERTEYSNRAKDIYVTPFEIKLGRPGIGNRLILQIENVKDAPLEAAGSEFVVIFPTETSTGLGAPICTNEQLNQVICRPLEPQAALWSQEPVTDGPTCHWVLTPPKGSKVFQKANLASFEFSNLVTQMPLGSCQVLVYWRGIKGRSPGHKLIGVTRSEAEPYVLSYRASLDGKPLKNKDDVDFKDKVRLDWNLFAADSCTISGIEEELETSGSREVLPVKKISTYKLTPQLTVDGRAKTGKDNILNFNVRPAEAKIEVNPDTVVRPKKVTLTWQCKSGDCFLSGPHIAREQVERSGSREVMADDGDYQIECIGINKRTESVAVDFPLTNAEVKLKPGSSANKVELMWKSTNAAGCKVTKRMGDITLSKEMSGSVEVEIPQSPGVGVWGNGSWNIVYIVQQIPKKFPEVAVQETVSGSQYKFNWNVTNVETCEVTGHGFKSTELKGEFTWEPKGAERRYSIGAAGQGVAMALQWQPSWKPVL